MGANAGGDQEGIDQQAEDHKAKAGISDEADDLAGDRLPADDELGGQEHAEHERQARDLQRRQPRLAEIEVVAPSPPAKYQRTYAVHMLFFELATMASIKYGLTGPGGN